MLSRLERTVKKVGGEGGLKIARLGKQSTEKSQTAPKKEKK